MALCQRGCHELIRPPYQLAHKVVGHVAVEVHANPVLLVHMVSRAYAFVAFLQFSPLFRRAFQVAEVEHVNVDEAEPLAAHLEHKQVAVVFGLGLC